MLGDRRAPHGPDQVGADRAPVEDAGAALGDQPVGVGQVGIALRRADRRRGATGQVELARGVELPERGGVVGDLLPERGIDGEAPLGDAGGGREQAAQRPRAPPAGGRLPGGKGARGADGEAADPGLLEVVRQPVRGVDEDVLGHRGGPGLPAVDGVHPPLPGVVVDEEPATADAGGERLGDPERRGGGNGGVDRVAAAPQYLEPDRGRGRINRRDGAAVSDGGGVPRRRAGVRGRRGGHQRGRGQGERGRHGQRGRAHHASE